MEKKLGGILVLICFIGMIIMEIVDMIIFFLPVILIGILLFLFVKICNYVYKENPDGFASAGSYLLTPGLILGWLYFLYVIWIYPTYWPELVHWGIIR